MTESEFLELVKQVHPEHYEEIKSNEVVSISVTLHVSKSEPVEMYTRLRKGFVELVKEISLG